MLTIDSPADAATPVVTAPGVHLQATRSDLWRVYDRGGIVIGHLQALASPDGVRWRARRFHRPSGTLRDLGDFWSPDAAVDSLRYGR